MLLSFLPFLFSCGSDANSQKEIELLKRENEILKKEKQLIQSEPKKKVFTDWSGTYSTYSEDVSYTAYSYYVNGSFKVQLDAAGRQTFFSIYCDCVSSSTLLKCFYKKTIDGGILGDFDSSQPIFVMKKENGIIKAYFNKYTIKDAFSKKSLPADSLVFWY